MLGAHACGINWHSSWCRFFGGNFWWARSDYVRSLPDISSMEPIPGRDLSRRHVCERWVGENPAIRALSLHESATDHYRDEYPRSCYAQVRDRPDRGIRMPRRLEGLENLFQDLIEPAAPSGCLLVHGTLSRPDNAGEFFRALPGRKAEIRAGAGLGAWYKPAISSSLTSC